MDKIKNILINGETNRTINDAIKVVDDSGSSLNISNIRDKKLGLKLVLLGLAEIQALRISNLSGKIYALENEVFSIENMKELDPRRLTELYNTAVTSMRDATEYVKNTVNSFQWDELELSVASESVSTDKDSDVSDIAAKLLDELSAKINMVTKPIQSETNEQINSDS